MTDNFVRFSFFLSFFFFAQENSQRDDTTIVKAIRAILLKNNFFFKKSSQTSSSFFLEKIPLRYFRIEHKLLSISSLKLWTNMIHKWQESRIIIKFNLSIIIIDNKSFFLNEETSNSKISNVNDNNITNGEYKNFIWNFINRYAVINVAWSRRTEKNFHRDSKTVRLEKLRSKYSKLYHPPCPSFYCFLKIRILSEPRER